jgi:hypothetical protein
MEGRSGASRGVLVGVGETCVVRDRGVSEGREVTEFVDPFEGELPPAPEPTPEQLAPSEGQWYQPYPERPRFLVLPESRWPTDLPKAHAKRWPERFYVETETGVVGLVPWPGSHVVWPWEAGWKVDMHRPSSEDAKPEGKKR